jgi:hypothetical protein
MLILLCGYPGSGRSTAASYLKEKYELPSYSLSEYISGDKKNESAVIYNLSLLKELADLKCSHPNSRLCIVKISKSSILLQNARTDPRDDEHIRMSFNYMLVNDGSSQVFQKSLDRLVDRLESVRYLDQCHLIEPSTAIHMY